jgi:peroxiredoxin
LKDYRFFLHISNLKIYHPPTYYYLTIPHPFQLKKLGIDSVVVYSVNDAAVMQAWAKDQKVGLGLIKLYGDPAGELTKALDMEMNHPGPEGKGLFGRCKRHALYVENGVIKAVHISESEDDPAGDADPSNTLADAMMKAIESAK